MTYVQFLWQMGQQRVNAHLCWFNPSFWDAPNDIQDMDYMVPESGNVGNCYGDRVLVEAIVGIGGQRF